MGLAISVVSVLFVEAVLTHGLVGPESKVKAEVSDAPTSAEVSDAPSTMQRVRRKKDGTLEVVEEVEGGAQAPEEAVAAAASAAKAKSEEAAEAAATSSVQVGSSLEDVVTSFRQRLQQFWDRDEVPFCRRWKELTDEQRETIFSMLCVNLAQGADPSGFSIPDNKFRIFVPEFDEESVKRFASKPKRLGVFIPKARDADLENDVEFLRGMVDKLQGITIKTGKKLNHEVSIDLAAEDGGEVSLRIFAVVRRLLILEVLVTLMDLVQGHNYAGNVTGREPLWSKKK